MSSRTWLLLLLLVALAVRLPTMYGVKRMGWDEHAYAYFAQTLNDRGIAGIRQLLQDYPTNENLKKSPLPLRLGFIVPTMLTCKLLGGFNGDNVAWFPFACGIALVLVGARFAERLSGRRAATICAALLITSPLAIALSRRAMSDNFVALLMTGALFFFDQCWRRRSVFDLLGLGLLLCLVMLTKESAILLYPMMALAGLYYYRGLKLRASWWTLAPFAVAPVIYLLVEIFVAGGVAPLLQTYRVYAGYQQTLDYTTRFEKGPWFRYLLDFFALSPVVFIAAVVGFSVVGDSETRAARTLGLIYIGLGIALFGQLPIVNVRLVLFLDLFLRLAAGMGVVWIAHRAIAKWSRPLLTGLVALLLATDALQFYSIFITGAVYNPTTFLLLRAQGFFDVH